MKFLTLIAIIFAASLSFAQEGSVSTSVDSYSTESSDKSGLYLGLDYMKLSDIKEKATLDFGDGSLYEVNYDSEGASVNMAGFRVGYANTPEVGGGWSAGARYNKGIGGGKGQNFYKNFEYLVVEGNGSYSLNQYVLGFAGVNFGHFVQSKYNEYYKTNLGFQAGLGIRPTPSIQWNLGYTLTRFTIDDTRYGYSEQGSADFGGLHSSLNYLF